MARIAIAGAGFAGLTALQPLAAAGHQVTVFDKARGPGGRLASKKVNDASWDMGAQFMRAHSAQFAAQLHDWAAQGLISEWNVEPCIYRDGQLQPSPDKVRRYCADPRMNALSRHLLQSAAGFISETRLTHSHYDGRHWTLTDEQHNSHGPFDALLLNMPPQQALPLCPDIHDWHTRLQQVDMLPSWTLLLSLSQPLSAMADAVFVEEGALRWIARDSSKKGRIGTAETWVLQASHGWSRLHADSPRHEVQQALLQAFSAIAGSRVPVQETWLHRWLYATPANPLGCGALSDKSHKLALCGDWCHSASLEGAWLSGHHAARELLTILAADC